tara:strand:+ start:188396 stop:188617 length:222 start_codon:yes stop_codon:yes gene_type:complete
MEKRSEHLQWCKDRAMEYAEKGDMQQAFASFQSDMSKHEETSNHLALEMGTMLLLGGHLSTYEDMKRWIEGCN